MTVKRFKLIFEKYHNRRNSVYDHYPLVRYITEDPDVHYSEQSIKCVVIVAILQRIAILKVCTNKNILDYIYGGVWVSIVQLFDFENFHSHTVQFLVSKNLALMWDTKN